MAIHAPVPEERAWENPPEGVHQGVIYAVELRKDIETKFGKKDKLMIKIQLSPESAGTTTYTNKDGKEVTNPFMVTYFKTLSMWRDGAKASDLRKFVEAIAQRKFADNKEAAAFDLESLVGLNGMFNVVHNPSADGEKIFANVETTMPLPKGIKPIKPVNIEAGSGSDLPF